MNIFAKARAYDSLLNAYTAAGIDLVALAASAAGDPEKITTGLLAALGWERDADDVVALADISATHPAIAPIVAAAVTKAVADKAANLTAYHASQLTAAGLKIKAEDLDAAETLKTAIAARSSTLAAELLAQRGFAPGTELEDIPPADPTKPGAKQGAVMNLTEFRALSHPERAKFRRNGGRIIDDAAA